MTQQERYEQAVALAEAGKTTEADKAFRQVLAIDESTDVADLARKGLSALAHSIFRGLSQSVERLDVVFYCVSALERFASMTRTDARLATLEIALLGQKGFQVNNADSRYTLRSMPGTFSGLQLVSYLYVGAKQFAPHLDIGFDLSREYAIAESLCRTHPGAAAQFLADGAHRKLVH